MLLSWGWMRTACMDVLLAILQSCMEEEIAGPAAGPYETFGGTRTNMVSNRLANFSPEILGIFQPRFVTFCSIIASEHRLWARQRQQVADGTELGTMVRADAEGRLVMKSGLLGNAQVDRETADALARHAAYGVARGFFIYE